MIFYRQLTFFIGLFLLVACGEQDSMTTKRTTPLTNEGDAATDPSKKNPPKKGGKGEQTNGNGDSGDEGSGESDGDGIDAGGGDDTGNDGDGLDPDPAVAGLAFFEKTVLPVFQAKCVSCHADPRMPADIRAPLSIYSYNLMKGKLNGLNSKDNGLINKVMNRSSHAGGDRCGAVGSSPCNEITQWFIIEKGDDTGGGASGGITGRVFEVTPLGKIIGWAYNTEDTTEQLSVAFYIDGPSGTGTKIGPTMANRSGADNNTPGDHAFWFDIPEQYRDKKKHTLHAYAVVDGKETLLSTTPYEFTAYALSQAGRNFYNQNVAGQVAGCGGCHVVSYEQHFYAMVSPAPSQGGTATNNVLINKAGTRNGTAHGGGNRCGGGGPCNVFEQWWQIEFGAQ